MYSLLAIVNYFYLDSSDRCACWNVSPIPGMLTKKLSNHTMSATTTVAPRTLPRPKKIPRKKFTL